ncbi:unnamed protein product [Rotaria sp. Silwood2]|nr:unnamed protein product [Rotaria sp. Silwood2]
MNDMTFNYDQILIQCLTESDDIQFRLSRMNDVSNALRKRSPISNLLKSCLSTNYKCSCHRKLIAGINRDISTVIDSREGTRRKHERYYKRLSNAIVISTINTHRPEDATSYLNSEISSYQQVLMEYNHDREQKSEIIQRLDPQLIVNCVTGIDELRYLLTKHIEQGFEVDETNELISYFDLLETIFAEKEDIKLAASHL